MLLPYFLLSALPLPPSLLPPLLASFPTTMSDKTVGEWRGDSDLIRRLLEGSRTESDCSSNEQTSYQRSLNSDWLLGLQVGGHIEQQVKTEEGERTEEELSNHL